MIPRETPPSGARRRPIYWSGDGAYGIDTCLPQAEAIARGQIRLRGLSHGHYPGRRLAADELPGLSSIGRWTTQGRQDWGVEPHRNEGIELCFLVRGRLAFQVEGRHFDLQPGQVTVTNPWQLHQLGDPLISTSDLVWLILDVGVRRPDQAWVWPPWILLTPADLAELAHRLRSGQALVLRAGAGLARSLTDLAAVLDDDGPRPPLSAIPILVNHALLELLAHLRREPEPQASAEDFRAQTVRLFLDDLRTNDASLAEEWDVGGMARACGLGVTVFTAQVQAAVGATPMAWLRRCRLERAAELLRAAPGRGVTEIALACGFTSSQYFATAFRVHFRQTPTTYRAGP